MPNILFKVGTLDLSNFVRVAPDSHMDIAQGDMLEPAFSDSPLFEGQFLTSLHAKNKEMKIPLYLHPPTPPYTQDALNKLVQQVNQALRPVTDFGATLLAEWKNAQASNSTFYTVQFGRFEPDFNFRVTEKGWLAGVLHLWTLPYGHTGTDRVISTYAAPANQSGLQVTPSQIFSGQPNTYKATVQADAPISYWRLDEASGTTATDQQVGAHSGTYSSAVNGGSGITSTGGAIGDGDGAERFSNSQFVDFGNPAAFQISTGSLEVWVNTTQQPDGNYHAIMSKDQVCGIFLLPTTGTLGLFDWTTGLNRDTGKSISDGNWHHIVVTFQSGVANGTIVYLDGVAVLTTTTTLTAQTVSLRVANSNSTQLLPCAADEAAIYSTVLTPAKVAAHYAANTPAVVGDLSPQFDLRVTTGSYTGDDGQIGLIAALPQPSYTPIIPVGSFFSLTPSAVIQGASGAWASQYLAMDKAAGVGTYSSLAQFKFAVSPGSVYATDDNRVLGLVRARSQPFGLRAFDSVGNPLGPTVVASAMDGWQLVDYGTLRVPAWQPTPIVTVQAFSGIGVGASGQFAPPRAGPGWTKEHGPVFVVPNSFSILDLDFNSPVLSVDGFDGASGVDPQNSYQLKQDQLGNSWVAFVTNVAGTQANGAIGQYTGQGGFVPTNAFALPSTMFIAVAGGSPISGDVEQEAIFTFPTASAVDGGLMQGAQIGTYFPALVNTGIGGTWIAKVHAGIPGFLAINGGGSVAIPSFLAGQYHLRTVSRGSLLSAYLSGPSGAFPAAASGAPLIATGIVPSIMVLVPPGVYQTPQVGFMVGFGASAATVVAEAFRARSLASTGHTSRDMLHLYQPLAQNTRAQTASGPDLVDLTSRQRGPVQAPILPVPSLGAGLFVASFPWDQGPANDVLNVDVRIRERFTYAR